MMNSPALAFSQTELCLSNGNLNPQAIGWSHRPHIHCALPHNKGRRKRWNHWCFTSPKWMLSITQADFDYVGYAAAYFLDLETGKSVAHSQLRLLGRGCELPDEPMQSHAFNHSKLSFQLNEYPGRASLSVSAADIGGTTLHVLLDIHRPPHIDSVNLVAPMGANSFHATCRQLALPITGTVQVGERVYTCEAEHSYGAMDFGRGVWPVASSWRRATFATAGGIAGNFGTQWTDYSGLSENALWFGGELCHIDCPIDITRQEQTPLATWHLKTADQRVNLSFTPLQRHRAHRKLGPLFADTRQWFGHFNGELLNPQGKRVPVQAALGWLGATDARW